MQKRNNFKDFGVQCYGIVEGEDTERPASSVAADAGEAAVNGLLRTRTPGRPGRTPAESLSRTSEYRPRSVWTSSRALEAEQRRVGRLNDTWQSEVTKLSLSETWQSENSKFSPRLTDSAVEWDWGA